MYYFTLTAMAMIAFAANSVLCRMALGDELIDAASFTAIRVTSGAICLLGFCWVRNRQWKPARPKGLSVLSLCVYMAGFSIAYQSLSTGTGALLLFGSVQIMMIGMALYAGERLTKIAWLGAGLAIAGLVYLLLPGLESPSLFYSALMALAGMAWGAYSLLGGGHGDPTELTASNFLYAVPLVLIWWGLDAGNIFVTYPGAVYAVISGAVTSGLGYAIWYKALRGITVSTASIVQLSVPALAALGGIALLSEPLTQRLVVSIVLTLSGIAIVLTRGKKHGPV